METVQERTQRSYNKLEWFFYIIILPLLFTSILTGVLLSFLGINVLQSLQIWLNQVPYVESVVPDPKIDPAGNLSSQEEVALLNTRLQQMDQEILKKTQDYSTMQKISEERKVKIDELQLKIKQLEKALEDRRISQTEQLKQIKELASMYAGMSASKAAPIIEKLTMEESVLVMKAMNPQQQAAIFAKMDPQRAADISVLLKDTQLNEDEQIAALQQRTHVLTQALGEAAELTTNREELIRTFTQMPAPQAAAIISNMMKTSEAKALSILSGLDDQARSQVLSEIANVDVQLAAKITNLLMNE